jgi:hypothetical protein
MFVLFSLLDCLGVLKFLERHDVINYSVILYQYGIPSNIIREINFYYFVYLAHSLIYFLILEVHLGLE